MAVVSAGVLPFRWRTQLEVLIAHPGGPLWAKKDLGAWSVVKGEVSSGEEPFEAAIREFAEETGWTPPAGPFLDLGFVELKSGKVVMAWAAAADYDPETLSPGTFEMMWPPHSGRRQSFPEIDQACWWTPAEARERLNRAQVPFLARLADGLEEAGGADIVRP